MSNEIGNQIKKVRDKNNLSQERFGKKVGISGKTVSAYETGRSVPSLKTISKISNTYNVTIVELPKHKSDDIKKKINDIQKIFDEIKTSISSGIYFPS